ncbi:hypothetical protein E2C01_000868 [Portunus trituberculatus]|uniref:Uncharacterized protein n=1 Tax=Portunus trituberculatus TaxID=210409 RepID=A0A5B7CFS4_PORTR|nr:hypothetical protein [Portunus trituberculatus]
MQGYDEEHLRAGCRVPPPSALRDVLEGKKSVFHVLDLITSVRRFFVRRSKSASAIVPPSLPRPHSQVSVALVTGSRCWGSREASRRALRGLPDIPHDIALITTNTALSPQSIGGLGKPIPQAAAIHQSYGSSGEFFNGCQLHSCRLLPQVVPLVPAHLWRSSAGVPAREGEPQENLDVFSPFAQTTLVHQPRAINTTVGLRRRPHAVKIITEPWLAGGSHTYHRSRCSCTLNVGHEGIGAPRCYIPHLPRCVRRMHAAFRQYILQRNPCKKKRNRRECIDLVHLHTRICSEG